MKHETKKFQYIPSEYEIYNDFDFDLSLNTGDYLYLFFYGTFVMPLLLIGRLLFLPFTSSFQKKSRHEHSVQPELETKKVTLR